MPRLSIVIPNLRFDPLVEHTLVSVLQNRPEYSEIIVVMGEKYDDPYELAREVRFLTVTDAGTRMDLLNHGCREARGDVINILMPGVGATDGWTDQVLHHFSHDNVAAVSPRLTSNCSKQRILALGVDYSARGSRRIVGAGVAADSSQARSTKVLAPTLFAGFYRTEVLSALQGFDPQLGEELADVELGLALRDLALTANVELQSRVTLGQSLVTTPKTFEQARQAERLFRRQLTASSSHLAHHLLVAAECLSGFPHPRMLTRVLGRMAARREVDSRLAYQRRLLEAKQQLQQISAGGATIRGKFGKAVTAHQSQSERNRRSAA